MMIIFFSLSQNNCIPSSSQFLLRFQNGSVRRETLVQGCRHVTTEKNRLWKLFPEIGSQICIAAIWNPVSSGTKTFCHHVHATHVYATKYSTILGVYIFTALSSGFLPRQGAILKAEQALGMSLMCAPYSY